MDLPNGYQMRRGTSGAGWDVYFGVSETGHLRLFWRPLKSADDASAPFTPGRSLKGWSEAEKTMDAIGQAIHRGTFDVSMVEDPFRDNPAFGRF